MRIDGVRVNEMSTAERERLVQDLSTRTGFDRVRIEGVDAQGRDIRLEFRSDKGLVKHETRGERGRDRAQMQAEPGADEPRDDRPFNRRDDRRVDRQEDRRMDRQVDRHEDRQREDRRIDRRLDAGQRADRIERMERLQRPSRSIVRTDPSVRNGAAEIELTVTGR
ncbi:hypothetical protein [Candidatus Nitrospira bockiana]